MKTWNIPNTDLEVSRIAYGCMKLGFQWNTTPLSAAEKSQAITLIETALAEGINFFDHADIYTLGKSEAVFSEIWQALSVARDSLIIQSKCGIRLQGQPNPTDPQRFDFSYQHIINSVEGILQRLKTDYLDILLLHRPDPLVEPEEVARAFDELHSSGKVRCFGVSNHTAAQIALLQKYLSQAIVINQVELNILHSYLIDEGVEFNRVNSQSRMAEGTLDFCRLNDIIAANSGEIAVALVAYDNAVRQHALYAGGHGRGAAVSGLNISHLEIIIGENAAPDGTDQNRVVTHAKIIERLGNNFVQGAMPAAGTIMSHIFETGFTLICIIKTLCFFICFHSHNHASSLLICSIISSVVGTSPPMRP